MDTKNAIIKTAIITCAERGLECWLNLDYGCGEGQGFGGYALYLPKSFIHHNINSPAGHFIFRVMQVAGVMRWDEVPGKTIRVRADDDRVEAIGHIVHNDWFCPKDDLHNDGKNVQPTKEG